MWHPESAGDVGGVFVLHSLRRIFQRVENALSDGVDKVNNRDRDRDRIGKVPTLHGERDFGDVFRP